MGSLGPRDPDQAWSPGWIADDEQTNRGASVFFDPLSLDAPPRGKKQRRLVPAPMKTIHPDGRTEWTDLGADEAASEEFVIARAAPYTLEELRRPFRRGRQSEAEARRYGHLAAIVAAAVEAGARRTTLARVLGHDKRRLSELARRGS